MDRWTNRLLAWCLFLTLTAGCGNTNTNSVAGVPNAPAQINYNFAGDTGTSFNAQISDLTASWQLTGTVPLTVVLLNNNPPVRINATKTANNSNLLSLQEVVGLTVGQLASTSAPFGTVSVTYGGLLTQVAPPADPDVRFFVQLPSGATYQALIEDLENAYEVTNVAPTLYLFENSDGRVDGEFNQLSDLGPFSIFLIINGITVADAYGGPTVSIVSP